jgi:hypothetical protein
MRSASFSPAPSERARTTSLTALSRVSFRRAASADAIECMVDTMLDMRLMSPPHALSLPARKVLVSLSGGLPNTVL